MANAKNSTAYVASSNFALFKTKRLKAWRIAWKPDWCWQYDVLATAACGLEGLERTNESKETKKPRSARRGRRRRRDALH